MKIDDLYHNSNLGLINTLGESASYGKTDEQQTKTISVLQKDSEEGTEVEISKKSVEIGRVAKMVENESMERAEKIKEIEEKISAGTYVVDSVKVADKILKDSLSYLMGT